MDGKIPNRGKQFAEQVKPLDRGKLKRRAIDACAITGAAWVLISGASALFTSDHHTDATPGNSSVPASSLVASFARDYVTTYLTSKRGQEQNLARYVTDKELTLPPVAMTFTDANVTYEKQIAVTDEGLAMWTVTVSGLLNSDSQTTPQRTYYRVPVAVFGGAPRAAGIPASVAGPSIGVDVKLGYSSTVTEDSPIGQTAIGFIRAYLTGSQDYSRYVTNDATDKPILPAPFARVDPVRIQANVANNGDGQSTADVYVTVAARTNDYNLTALAYPLSMRSVEGKWQVASIAQTPLLQLAANKADSSTTSTPTTTASAPPPNRQ